MPINEDLTGSTRPSQTRTESNGNGHSPRFPDLETHHPMQFSVISKTSIFLRKRVIHIFRGYTYRMISPVDRVISIFYHKLICTIRVRCVLKSVENCSCIFLFNRLMFIHGFLQFNHLSRFFLDSVFIIYP